MLQPKKPVKKLVPTAKEKKNLKDATQMKNMRPTGPSSGRVKPTMGSAKNGKTIKKAQDGITRKQVTNPDGSVTYKQSWSSSTPGTSSSSKKSTPSVKKPGQNAVSSSTVTRRSTPPVKTSGEREITSIPTMKTAGVTSKPEVKASATPEIRKKGKTVQESRLERYGQVGERVYGKGEKKEGYATPGYVGKKTNKKAKKCTNC